MEILLHSGADRRARGGINEAHSSPSPPPAVVDFGFSITQSSPEFLHRLQGGSSAPMQRIFIRRQ
jgi:hypothetical protein